MAIFDNGKAPETDSAKVGSANVPRSAFNMSRVHTVTGLIGAYMPIDVLETVPNEDYTINYASLIEARNPLAKPLQSGLKMVIHSYYQSCRDIWKGWDMFADRGRNGMHSAEIPKLYPAVQLSSHTGNDKDVANDYSTLTPCSPADYMGIPIASYDPTRTNKNYCYLPTKITSTTEVNKGAYGNNASNTTKWGLNALPFAMYENICREYLYNKNLLGNNTTLYPLDEDDWKLPFGAGSSSDGYINHLDGTIHKVSAVTDAIITDGDGEHYVPVNTAGKGGWLNCLHFRQFRGDYFTTGNPFPDLIRGNRDLLKIDATVDFTECFKSDYMNNLTTDGAAFSQVRAWLGTKYDGWGTDLLQGGLYDSQSTQSAKYLENEKGTANQFVRALNRAKVQGVTLNNLRKAAVMEKFMQRNAITDGSYKSFVGVQFGYTPRIHESKPVYIGGCSQDIYGQTIEQTSSTSGTQMLGQKAGNISSGAMGNIGKFHADDYGYIITCACIIPDVYYDNQGIDTMWTRTKQEDMYIPLLNNLEPQAIKNKELFVKGDTTYDEDVWAYANKFEDMKSRRNIVGGLSACGSLALTDSQGWIKRKFDTNNAPQLNMSFLTMSPKNIDLLSAGFSSANEPPFKITFGCSIDKVSPMPFTATPADLGIRF